MASPLAHGSIALVAKRLFPAAPLWALLISSQIPDILSFLFIILGVEIRASTTQDIHSGIQYVSTAFIPWSHGLTMCLVWTVLAAAIMFLIRKNKRESAVVGAMVMSHWMLDAIVYSNLPLFFDDSIRIGFGLATFGTGFIIGIVMEASIIIGSIAFFLCTRKQWRTKTK